MGLFDSLRPLAKSRRKSRRGKKSNHSSRQARMLKPRDLRLEQFEARMLLSAGTWVSEGPSPIDYGQTENVTPKDNTGNPLNEVDGAVETVVTSPTNANVMYIGTVNGGVWETTDALDTSPTWTPLTDTKESLSIGAMAIDPTNANNIVAGVGHVSAYSLEGGSLIGILHTTDGGATWQQQDGGGVLDGKSISGVVVRGSTIVLSVSATDSGSANDCGIYRSTDGGNTFTEISGSNGLPHGISYDVEADPTTLGTNSTTIYTNVVGSAAVGGAKGIYRSTDTGKTWVKVSDGFVNGQISTAINGFNEIGTGNIRMSVGYDKQLYIGIVKRRSDRRRLSPRRRLSRREQRQPSPGRRWTRRKRSRAACRWASTRKTIRPCRATPWAPCPAVKARSISRSWPIRRIRTSFTWAATASPARSPIRWGPKIIRAVCSAATPPSPPASSGPRSRT